MVKAWIIYPHQPQDFPHSLIKIKDGVRYIDDFIKSCQSLPFITTIDIESNDDFINISTDVLNLNEQNRAATLNLKENNNDNTYIQLSYMQDYIYYINDLVKEKGEEYLPKGVVQNYFGSLVNNQNENIYGNALVFKVDNKKLVDLEATEIFSLLCNFYYVKTYQVRNGELVEITFPNLQPIIADALKDRHKHVLDLWEFYGPQNMDYSDLGVVPVNISDYEGLIILKQKENMNEVWKALKQVEEKEGINKVPKNDIRGLYEDLNKEYLQGFFS